MIIDVFFCFEFLKIKIRVIRAIRGLFYVSWFACIIGFFARIQIGVGFQS